MRVSYATLTAAELKPGMRLYHPSLVAGWTALDAKATKVYDEERSYADRIALKFEGDSIFTAYPTTRRFRVIGRRSKPGHEHDFVETYSADGSGAYRVFSGLSCTQCGETL